ncbi:hypothetical protein IG631_13443 [Alternaria alternata]|nr:hypothetical protein IG631_13443 [Alternaria alternata]
MNSLVAAPSTRLLLTNFLSCGAAGTTPRVPTRLAQCVSTPPPATHTACAACAACAAQPPASRQL